MSKTERDLPCFRYRLQFLLSLFNTFRKSLKTLPPYKQLPNFIDCSFYFFFLPSTSLAPSPYFRHASFYFWIITTQFFLLSHHCSICLSSSGCSTNPLYLPQVPLTSKINQLFSFLVEIPLSALNSSSLALISLLKIAVIYCYASLYIYALYNIHGIPGGSDGKESACNVRQPGLILGLGRFLEEGNGYLRQYCCLENSMDRGA